MHYYGFIIHPQLDPLRDRFYNKIQRQRQEPQRTETRHPLTIIIQYLQTDMNH